MLQPVEVCHDGRWLAATLMATRHDDDGWHGLVGYTDPETREGFYRWFPEALLRDPPVTVVDPAPAVLLRREQQGPRTYEPPSGWVEQLDDPDDDTTAQRMRFHRDPRCHRIRQPETLTSADRPGSAARCPACAPD